MLCVLLLCLTPPDPVRAVLEAQVSAWNRGDLPGFMATYWTDDRLTFASGGTLTRGWQATLDRYRKRYQEGGQEMGTLTFSELAVEPLGESAAWVRGRYGLVFTRSDDRPTGLFTLVLRKLPEGWRIVHDHTSAAEVGKKN
jgi:beta-aspartyl-peptidase (threonine type)